MHPKGDSWLYVSDLMTIGQQFYKLKGFLRSISTYHSYHPDYNYYLGGAEYFTGNKDTGTALIKKAARAGSKPAINMLKQSGVSY